MKYLLLCLALSCTYLTSAQIGRLPLSPLQKTVQRVGLTDVTLEYCRPSLKGRTIFGSLEPFGETWRTGANRNTKITFSHYVSISGYELEPDTYALITRPSTSHWDVYLYTDTDNWDVPDTLDTSKIAAHINVPITTLGRYIETLSIGIENIKESAADLVIMWERTHVAVPIDFHTHDHMTALMERQLHRDAADYHIAAAYLQERNMELEKAKVLMEKSIFLNDESDVWDYRVMALILDQMGERSAAITALKKSLKLAKEQGHNNGIRENAQLLREWGVTNQ